MGVQRDRVAAFRDALAGTGAAEIRMPFATKDAADLCTELKPEELRHPEACKAGIIALSEVGEGPAEGDTEGVIRFFERLSKAANLFWDAFEGQLVDGVEIIRRR